MKQSLLITVTRPLDQPLREITMAASSVPAGVNITFDYISSGSPGVIKVRQNNSNILSIELKNASSETCVPFLGAC